MNDKNRDDLINFASQKLNIDKDSAKKAINENKGEELLSKLSQKDKEKVSKVMQDPELTKKILSSPQAMSILKNLFGEK